MARRFSGSERIRVNADMGPADVRKYCEVDVAAQPLLRAAAQRLGLSTRAFYRAFTLARKIAGRSGDHRHAAPRRGAAIPAAGGGGVRCETVYTERLQEAEHTWRYPSCAQMARCRPGSI